MNINLSEDDLFTLELALDAYEKRLEKQRNKQLSKHENTHLPGSSDAIVSCISSRRFNINSEYDRLSDRIQEVREKLGL